MLVVFLFLVNGAWTFAIGLRFFLMPYDYIYKINSFDKLFDWFPLIVFGIFFIFIGISFFIEKIIENKYHYKKYTSRKIK